MPSQVAGERDAERASLSTPNSLELKERWLRALIQHGLAALEREAPVDGNRSREPSTYLERWLRANASGEALNRAGGHELAIAALAHLPLRAQSHGRRRRSCVVLGKLGGGGDPRRR